MNITHIEKPFCVIGPCTTVGPWPRRGAARGWFQEVQAAEQHAIDLLRRNPHGHPASTTELFVVQVVRVVRTPVNYEILAVKP